MHRALLALALVALGTSLAACGDTDPRAGQPSSSPTPMSSPSPVEEPSARRAYYLGPGPDGPDGPDTALYPYPADGTVVDLLTQPPLDEDYRTLWPRGSIVAVDEGEVQIDGSVPADRPSSMSGREAALTVQQVLYTLRDHSGQEIDRIRFVRDGAPAASVWGVETNDGFVDLQAPLAVLSFLSLIHI